MTPAPAATALSGARPRAHDPERDHRVRGCAASRSSSGCCSARTTGFAAAVAPRRARRDRLGRRLRGPPLRPGVRARQGARPDRRPAAVHRLRRRHHHRRHRRRLVQHRSCSRARSSSAATLVVLTLLRDEALRRHVGGQGRHVRAHVLRSRLLPARRATSTVRGCSSLDRAGATGHPGPACSATTPPSTYVPRCAGRCREGRAEGGSAPEGRDHGRRRGHPAAAAHLERPEADAAGGQPADDGARHPPAAPARLRRDRRDGGVPRQRHQELLRRRLRVRREDHLRRREHAARHRRLGAATPGSCSTSASS